MEKNEIPILSCRAMDPSQYPRQFREIWDKSMAELRTAGMPEPMIYPGSIEGSCQMCTITVAIGPRQQDVIKSRNAQDKGVIVACILCSTMVGPSSREVRVRSLGNPYLP